MTTFPFFVYASYVVVIALYVGCIACAAVRRAVQQEGAAVIKPALAVCAVAFVCGLVPMLAWHSFIPTLTKDNYEELIGTVQRLHWANNITIALLCAVLVWRFASGFLRLILFVLSVSLGIYAAYVAIYIEGFQEALLPPFIVGAGIYACAFLCAAPVCVAAWFLRRDNRAAAAQWYASRRQGPPGPLN
ncbi:hypothetical protein [Corynebacterium lizhenjunii]|uniref:hypothetical protein n=1 Tax=Corynebacterium lizhenjunii TaxID=2709394 RepID=UPI0013ED6918|nr:hypothetical protein [Corynebacterium lizhenjunii]